MTMPVIRDFARQHARHWNRKQTNCKGAALNSSLPYKLGGILTGLLFSTSMKIMTWETYDYIFGRTLHESTDPGVPQSIHMHGIYVAVFYLVPTQKRYMKKLTPEQPAVNATTGEPSTTWKTGIPSPILGTPCLGQPSR